MEGLSTSEKQDGQAFPISMISLVTLNVALLPPEFLSLPLKMLCV